MVPWGSDREQLESNGIGGSGSGSSRGLVLEPLPVASSSGDCDGVVASQSSEMDQRKSTGIGGAGSGASSGWESMSVPVSRASCWADEQALERAWGRTTLSIACVAVDVVTSGYISCEKGF